MCMWRIFMNFFFFLNDTATTEIYTLSLHDALPIYTCNMSAAEQAAHAPHQQLGGQQPQQAERQRQHREPQRQRDAVVRSEEHTSELQSPCNLVCRLLLAKKTLQSILPDISDHVLSR